MKSKSLVAKTLKPALYGKGCDGTLQSGELCSQTRWHRRPALVLDVRMGVFCFADTFAEETLSVSWNL